jgi:hypothetical protein
MDQRAILDHQFTVAAYAVTWAIQLGYVAWLALKWRKIAQAAFALEVEAVLPAAQRGAFIFQFVEEYRPSQRRIQSHPSVGQSLPTSHRQMKARTSAPGQESPLFLRFFQFRR